MALTKPFVGRQYGCNDTSGPENYTAYQLSRLTDAMFAAQQAGLDYKDIFILAPAPMRMEWNYSNWKYVEGN
jgi:hypothetical protein